MFDTVFWCARASPLQNYTKNASCSSMGTYGPYGQPDARARRLFPRGNLSWLMINGLPPLGSVPPRLPPSPSQCRFSSGAESLFRGHVHMTSAKFSGFLTPPPPLSEFCSDLQYRIHATSLTTSSFGSTPPPPSVWTSYVHRP